MGSIACFLKCVVRFLNTNSGALTFIVTAIYTITTIAILIANSKAAKAANDQIIASNNQYEKTKRLQVLPVFKLSLKKKWESYCEYTLPLSGNKSITTVSEAVSLFNIGNGPAINLSYKWKYSDSASGQPFGISFIKADEEIIIRFIFAGEIKTGIENGTFTITFHDIFGTEYHQEILFGFDMESQKPSLICLNTSYIDFDEHKEAPHA